jgi:hypothetical protein
VLFTTKQREEMLGVRMFEDADLFNTREYIKGMSHGVLIVSMKYARGTNLKF